MVPSMRTLSGDQLAADGAAVLAPDSMLVDAVDKPIPKKTFTPIKDLIAVHYFEQKRTKQGIVLPEGSKDRPATARALVIAIGPEVKSVKEGDIVVFSGEIIAARVRHLWQESIVMQEIQVLGVEDPLPDCPTCGAKNYRCKHAYDLDLGEPKGTEAEVKTEEKKTPDE
jgi:co-chaperonin GroES (HSP10)